MQAEPDLKPSSAPPPSATGPLVVWLGVQLIAVALVAARVPLAAAYPRDAERLAAYWVFGVQVVAASMLFPFLLRDARLAVQVICAAVPFQLAAFALAGEPWDEWPAPGSVVVGWLVALACWAVLLRSARAQMIGVALASCLTLGGAMVRYLRLEFSTVEGIPTNALEAASPLLTTLAALDHQVPWAGIVTILSVGFSGVAFHAARRIRASASTEATSLKA